MGYIFLKKTSIKIATWFETSSELSATLAHQYPDRKIHGANMGPIWVLSAPDGPHVGPMNLAIKIRYAGTQIQCGAVMTR